jgi:hypothetical protein
MIKPVNPELADVDPFSPNLTTEQKAMILDECMINPVYFFELVVKKPNIIPEVTVMPGTPEDKIIINGVSYFRSDFD